MIVLVGAGCGDDGGSSSTSDASVPDAGCTPSATIYLNNQGGTYTAGAADDSYANVSSVLDMARTLEPWGTVDIWNDLVSCFRQGVSQFNVEVVETDPGDVDHTEIVFTTTTWIAGAGSLAPLLCTPGTRPIAYMFDVYGSNTTSACEAALQIWGNAAVSLDHAFECSDYMTFLTGCGAKGWVDQDVPCGEYEARDCQCLGVGGGPTGPTQNSYQRLLNAYGPPCN